MSNMSGLLMFKKLDWRFLAQKKRGAAGLAGWSWWTAWTAWT
jgi:hypothetical protein